MASWAVAIAQWNMGHRARSNLELQGFECYFPKLKEVRVVKGRRETVEKFMFGRYFFVSLLDHWRSISGTRGVTGMLLCGDHPSVVKDSVIQEIKSREVDGFIWLSHDVGGIKIGQQVRVISGPLTGSLGIYRGMNRKDREVALIRFLGRTSRVELAAGSLVAA